MKRSIQLSIVAFIVWFACLAGATSLAPQPKFTALDSNGDPLVGAFLYTYETGTTTPKETWTDATKSTPNPNPIILDSYGQANVWIDSSGGAYRLKLLDAEGDTIWTVDGIEDLASAPFSSLGVITNPVKSDQFLVKDGADGTIKTMDIEDLNGNVYYPDYTVLDQGDSAVSGSLAYYVDQIGTDDATIVLRHNSGLATTTYALSTSETIPGNINLQIEKGALISINLGKTLTIYSPANIQAASNQQIFDCDLAGVVFTVAGIVQPNWWKTNTTPGTTDMGPAINKAIATECDVELIEDYATSVTLTGFVDNQSLYSKSGTRPTISTLSDITAINCDEDFLTLKNFKLQGSAAGTTSTTSGIKITNCTRGKFDNIDIRGFAYGVRMAGASARYVNDFISMYLYSNKVAGFYGLGHATNIIGGEIAASPFGIFQGVFDGFTIDKDVSAVLGTGINISGTTIEAITSSGGVGGVAIYVGLNNSGFNITGCYFESVETVLQLGESFKNDGMTPHTSLTSGGSMTGCYIGQGAASSTIGVKAERARGWSVNGNYFTGADTTVIDMSTANYACQIANFNNVGATRQVSAFGTQAGYGMVVQPNSKNAGRVFSVEIPTSSTDPTLVEAIRVGSYSNQINTVAFPYRTQFLGAIGLNNAGSLNIRSGTGSPEGVVQAVVGSIYLRDDGSTGTTLYVKETGGIGNTGWVAK